ncbi:MAG: hypothetical protein EA384_13945 [Spirochaetaceae bacterium]|nr:MAG: hypothetical protein EA384_13945 [Spirochaetaceae bacterium]
MNQLPVTALLIVAALLAAACATGPTESAAAPDSGFPYRAAETPRFAEPPEPLIRIVDLARLRIGMTKEEVLAIFPDPTTINVSVRGLEVWEYGFAQLHFRQGLLANWFDLTGVR